MSNPLLVSHLSKVLIDGKLKIDGEWGKFHIGRFRWSPRSSTLKAMNNYAFAQQGLHLRIYTFNITFNVNWIVVCLDVSTLYIISKFFLWKISLFHIHTCVSNYPVIQISWVILWIKTCSLEEMQNTLNLRRWSKIRENWSYGAAGVFNELNKFPNFLLPED